MAQYRVLTGAAPKAWFGDSADPANPQVRTPAEEAARVVRSRVLNPKWIAVTDRRPFPFGASVGHDDAKLALRLAALDPLIGVVLLRGQKGSAKTTLARVGFTIPGPGRCTGRAVTSFGWAVAFGPQRSGPGCGGEDT